MSADPLATAGPAGRTPLLDAETRRAVTRLAEAVLAVKPLAGAVDRPLRIALPAGGGAAGPESAPAGENWQGIGRLLDRVATQVGTPRLTLCPGLGEAVLGVFERAVGNRLGLATGCGLDRIPAAAFSEVDEAVEEVRASSFVAGCMCSQAVSFDGTPLRAYAAGNPRGKAIVLASACGMPVELCERWVRFLAPDYRVVTWESRGLFGGSFDGLAWDVAAQAADLFAVMDHFGMQTAHLMGLCGGAVIAIAAAAARPGRATSLSVWHGDFELAGCPKTSHQDNLKALLAMAGEDRQSAAAVQALFCRSMLRNPLPDLAHLILYPYANGELLHRYGRLNGSIMETDVQPLLGRVPQPILVVTSEDDDKAHPAGSLRVAAELANATLHVEPHGDHISLFDAGPGLIRVAAAFLAGHG